MNGTLADPRACALRWARLALGVLFLVRTTPILFALSARFGADRFPLLGWPTNSWTVPAAGLGLPAVLVGALCVGRTIAAMLFLFGIRARAAGVVAAVAGHLVLAQDRFGFVNSLHILYTATFVLALTVTRGAVASSVRLISLFLASIYGWAGAAKLTFDWLSGRSLDAQQRAGAFAGPLGGLVERAWVQSVASWSVPLIELVIATLLVLDRRRSAIVLALAFHVLIELTVKPDLLGSTMAVLLFAVWPRLTREGSGRTG